jgi:uncharacterized membrane protein YqjE
MMSYDSSGIPSHKQEGSSISGEGKVSGNWMDAIPSLIASRIGIIRIESQDAIEIAVRKLIILSVALFALFATWALLTAGLIGVIADHFKCPWYFAAFSAGGVYLLISLVMLVIIKRAKKTESFPVTRAEFEKDRQWLNQLKNRSNSQS